MGKGSKKAQITGYRYYFDLLMGICRGPVDALVAIRVGDDEAWPGNSDGSVPLSDAAYLQSLFNPGAAGPSSGSYQNQASGPINQNAAFSINKPNLFGGDKGEGGILGNLWVMMGAAAQIIPTYVKDSITSGSKGHTYSYSEEGVGTDTSDDADASKVAKRADISEFRGVATLFYSGTVTSNNPYPKAWKIRTQRALAGWDALGPWYPEKAIVPLQGGAVRGMNAAHIVYQALTDATWGRGLNRSELDDTAFRYAADVLYGEGLGLSTQWDKSKDISDFIQDIINHIAGMLTIDRGTGLIRIKLVRNDYTPDALPIFDYSSGLLKVESSDATSDVAVPNEVIVKWHDPITDKDRQVKVHNLAMIQSTGAKIADTKDYSGICDPDVAARAAMRDLKVYAASLSKFKLTLDRRAWRMQPGEVMKFTALDRGIFQRIVRVLTYEDGTLTDGTITVECTDDVFAVPTLPTSVDPGVIDGSSGSAVAVPPTEQFAYEASYYDMQRGLTAAQRQEVTSTEGGVIVLAGRPTSSSMSGEIMSSADGEDSALTGTASFAPTGKIKGPTGFYTTALQLSGGKDLSLVKPGSLAIIFGCTEGQVDDPYAIGLRARGEMVRVDAINLDTGIVTVARGVVDTKPKLHAPGATIVFHDSVMSGNTDVYATGESVDVSILTRTARDVLDPAAAKTNTVVVGGRWAKPYLPGNVRINGKPGLSDYGEGFFVSGALTLSWASRNKVLQADQLISQPEASVTPEDGTTYVVEIFSHGVYNDAGVFVPGHMLRRYDGLTATTFSYTDADAANNGDPIEIDIVLYTVVNGEASLEHYVIYVVKIEEGAGGYGNTYGFYYGGPPA